MYMYEKNWYSINIRERLMTNKTATKTAVTKGRTG